MVEDAGRVHRVLRAVAGAGGELAAQHERHGAVAAEHVPGLGDLVEELVGGDPHEVGVHELDDRAEPAVQRHAAAQAGERVLADRRAEHPVGELLQRPPGGAVGAALEPVDVLAQHDDRLVRLHAAGHDVADDVDELALRELAARRCRAPAYRLPVQLAQVAADADVDEAGSGHRSARIRRCPRLAVGHGLEQRRRRSRCMRLARPRRRSACELVLGDQPAPERRARASWSSGSRSRQARLLLLGAVAEGAARVGAVLVEEAVDLGLDDRRARRRRACAPAASLHRQVHGERVHAVDPPARDAEARARARTAAARRCLADGASTPRTGCSR